MKEQKYKMDYFDGPRKSEDAIPFMRYAFASIRPYDNRRDMIELLLGTFRKELKKKSKAELINWILSEVRRDFEKAYDIQQTVEFSRAKNKISRKKLGNIEGIQ
jgi:hypothetical protein